MARRVPKTNQSMVPIVFTLGVIGWGFFVIDRITRPPQQNKPSIEKKIYNVPHQNTKSWKDSLLSIVDRFDNKKKAKENQKQIPLSIIDENNSSFIKKYAPIKDKHRENPIQKQFPVFENKLPVENDPLELQTQKDKKTAQVYFFQFGKGELPHLLAVERSFSHHDIIANVFRAVIQGPSKEEKDMFVDSFPIKPMLHAATKTNNVLVLDFNEDFGRSVSLPMFLLQLKQLLKTAQQFDSHNIRITINGEQKSYIGGDGLFLPHIINQELLSTLRK